MVQFQRGQFTRMYRVHHSTLHQSHKPRRPYLITLTQSFRQKGCLKGEHALGSGLSLEKERRDSPLIFTAHKRAKLSLTKYFLQEMNQKQTLPGDFNRSLCSFFLFSSHVFLNYHLYKPLLVSLFSFLLPIFVPNAMKPEGWKSLTLQQSSSS